MSITRADGSVVIEVNLDARDVDKELARLKAKILRAEEDLTTGKYTKSVLTAQFEKLEKAYHSLSEKAKAGDVGAQQRLEAVGGELDRLHAQVEKQTAAVENAQIQMDGLKLRYGEVEHSAMALQDAEREEVGVLDRLAEARTKAQKRMEQFSRRMKQLISGALVFNVVSSGLRSFTSWMKKVILSNDEARAAIARLEGALLTMIQPLVSVIIPAFTAFVNVLTQVVTVIARLVSAIFGKTFESSKDAAGALYDEADALDSVGSAAKGAAGALAPFDEINTLAGNAAGGVASAISPDFSGLGLSSLPEWLKNLTLDLEAKISQLRFSWDKGEIFKNQDAWIIFLTGLLGAVIGSMFGGLVGGIIGLLLGLSIGLISCTFLDKLENPEKAKKALRVALSAILGAVLGAMFGGLPGAVIGLLLGTLISLVSLEFEKGDASNWDKNDTLVVVLSAILGAILGAAFGGLAGGVIGLLLGATISFVAIKFKEGDYDKSKAIAALRIALLAILGAVLGAMFGGLVGSVIGLLVGLTIGFTSVAFDDKLKASVRSAAQKALKIAITTIIGALIGAVFGGGIFGGIIGGVIGLTFGLAVTLTDAKIKNALGSAKTKGTYSGGKIPSVQSFARSGVALPRISQADIPRLARGTVVPQNREFLAVLGDNKRETEVVSPLSTMKQAVLEALREAGGEGQPIEVKLYLDGKQIARNQIKHINAITQAAGKPVLLV